MPEDIYCDWLRDQGWEVDEDEFMLYLGGDFLFAGSFKDIGSSQYTDYWRYATEVEDNYDCWYSEVHKVYTGSYVVFTGESSLMASTDRLRKLFSYVN